MVSELSREMCLETQFSPIAHVKPISSSPVARTRPTAQSPSSPSQASDEECGHRTCPPCSIDEAMETQKVLKHVDKLFQRIPVEEQDDVVGQAFSRNSACSSMTFRELAQHLISIRTGYIPRLARPVVQKLIFHPKNANIFNSPVDPVALNLPSYLTVIKTPMDLGTIKSRLQTGFYTSVQQCFDDVRLVFQNAISFNGPEHFVAQVAKELLEECEEEIRSVEEKFAKEMERKSLHKCGACKGSTCSLCGQRCLKLETPSLFCSAATCGQRIKKNAVYFISADGYSIWCQKCHGNLPAMLYEGIPGVASIAKKSLLKRRFDEEIAEPWVECGKCGSWSHQICALFSSFGQQKGSALLFNCPMCMLESGKKPAVVSPLSNSSLSDYSALASAGSNSNSDHNSCSLREMPNCGRSTGTWHAGELKSSCWRASSLPQSRLSRFLECMVKDLLHHTGHGAVANSIHIRMTSNYDSKFEIPTCVRDNFQGSDGRRVHEHVAFRQKCIQLFQTIDGIDVCVFSLYVHEFDESCPPPNKSSVYIAYLDSVDYFRPSTIRTAVYQELVVAYLQWAQARGFRQCHLWSCPPQRGDNFIFWCHPAHQRTPSRDRLNSWYSSIMQRCRALKISKSIDKFWNTYFSGYQANRREEVVHRQAAKNSFVGTGKVASRKGKNLPPLAPKPSNGTSRQTPTESTSLGAQPLICPPIFDGDYWMLEFVRLHNGLMQKDPMVGGPQSQAHYRWCKDTVKMFIAKPTVAAFRQPVDPVALNIPLYPTIIQKPMDLGTVKEKLRCYQYETMLSFVEDVRLTFNNAMLFNPEGHFIHQLARQLLQEFEKVVSEYVVTWLASFFPLEYTTDQILEQCKLGCPAPPSGSDAASFSRSRTNSSISITALDPLTSQDSQVSNYSRSCSDSNGSADLLAKVPMDCDEGYLEVGDRARSAKQVKILLEPSGLEHSDPCRKRSLSRVISEDSYQLLDDCGTDPLSVLTTDTASTISFASLKRRRGSMDSLSTAADFEDALDLLADDSQGDDFPARDALRARRATFVSDHYTDYTFSASNYNSALVYEQFSGPKLAPRSLNFLVSDLSKGVHRMNDDLFVVKLADRALPATGVDSTERNSLHAATEGNTKDADGRKRGRLPASGRQLSLHLEFSAECQQLLHELAPDTSDPDPVVRSPLVDSRYIFLETCQYRHYQFDSLRRAKYSSLMMLYHLYNPYDRSCRPLCKYCGEAIHGMRWHCDQCPDFDMCDPCKVSCEQYEAAKRSRLSKQSTAAEHSDCEDTVNSGCRACHAHPLTPYRVTFC